MRTVLVDTRRGLPLQLGVIFTPQGQLLSSGGICLGDTTNNVVEYSAFIELLRDALSLGISHLRVYLTLNWLCRS
jgi:ribonuclease HI